MGEMEHWTYRSIYQLWYERPEGKAGWSMSGSCIDISGRQSYLSITVYERGDQHQTPCSLYNSLQPLLNVSLHRTPQPPYP